MNAYETPRHDDSQWKIRVNKHQNIEHVITNKFSYPEPVIIPDHMLPETEINENTIKNKSKLPMYYVHLNLSELLKTNCEISFK